MKKHLIGSLLSVLCLQTAIASEPITISDPTPAVAAKYEVGQSAVVVYTMSNNVPGQSTPINVSGLSGPLSRTTVSGDCGNALPAGPSTCHIGVSIAPTTNDANKTIDQDLLVDYAGRTPLTKHIHFTVEEKQPEIPSLVVSTTSMAVATEGVSRQIKITSVGSDAHHVTYEVLPELPAGTTITPSTCGDLSHGQSCILTIKPGSTPNAIVGGLPAPATIKIHADDSNVLNVTLHIVTLGSAYQQGYLFDIDDTTPITSSIGGSLVALKDNSVSLRWNNGSDIVTGANSIIEGEANTSTIIKAQGTGSYAASLCASYEVDALGNTPCQSGSTCYKNWYLPAICQMGPETNDSGCTPGTPNIDQNLVQNRVGNFSLVNNYWSSTEFVTSADAFAWYQFFGDGTDVNAAFHGVANKYVDFFAVRCARAVTPV